MATGPRTEIPVESRLPGKHFSRQSRVHGRVPGIVYGPKTQPTTVTAEERYVLKLLGKKSESVLFNLKSEDSKLDKLVVLLRDVQLHPVTRRPMHLDFYALDMDSKIRLSVALRFEGKPKGLADGGMLELIVREVEIEVSPSEIPEDILADVSELGVGDALHVSDLKLPASIRMISQSTLTLATVQVPKEEAATPASAAPTDAAAAPAAGAAAKAAPAKDDKKK